MTEPKKWQRFESLVANVQKTLSPKSKVNQNERVFGKHSQTWREVDITIRQDVGQFDLFIVIDCKDYSIPVDVKDVEEFIGLVEDVAANKGAIVSASGFTEAAKKRAESSGIDLYRLVDAEAHDWQTYVTIPVLCDFRRIKRFSFEFKTTGQFRMFPQDFKTMPLYNQKGELIDILLNLLSKRWNSKLIPIEPGEYKDIKLTDEISYIKTEGELYQMDVSAHVQVERNLYFGQLQLLEIKGFADQIKGGVITTGFTTDVLDSREVEGKWQKVDSLENWAVKAVLTFLATDHYPLLKAE